MILVQSLERELHKQLIHPGIISSGLATRWLEYPVGGDQQESPPVGSKGYLLAATAGAVGATGAAGA